MIPEEEVEAAAKVIREEKYTHDAPVVARHALLAAAKVRGARESAVIEALMDARSAIASLDEDAFGYGHGDPPHEQWPIRNELLDKIDRALKETGQ